MSLGLTPNLSLTARSGGSSPIAQLRALLFSAGEAGWMYNNTDPATMWQDLARTVPVTATGQAVRIQNDLSGNGNHRSQPTSDASRPLYTTDANGRLGLRYDGTDDWLQTSAITPGTDKAQLFGVYRKLSDSGAAQMIVETSTNLNLVNGAIHLFGRDVAGFETRSRGTATASAAGTASAAPVTGVLTVLGDIAGDSVVLRNNGTQIAQSAADQGTGNYLAYPVYFGRRGGVSLPFNGHALGIEIGRFGSNLTLAQVQQVEALLNQVAGGVF